MVINIYLKIQNKNLGYPPNPELLYIEITLVNTTLL